MAPDLVPEGVWTAMMLAPEKEAPDSSMINPLILEVVTCAFTIQKAKRKRTKTIFFRFFIVSIIN